MLVFFKLASGIGQHLLRVMMLRRGRYQIGPQQRQPIFSLGYLKWEPQHGLPLRINAGDPVRRAERLLVVVHEVVHWLSLLRSSHARACDASHTAPAAMAPMPMMDKTKKVVVIVFSLHPQ
jgi:hypothetical protein